MNRLISRVRGRGREAGSSNGNGINHERATGSGLRTARRASYVVTAAESASCTCPDFCERDHANE